MLSFRSHQSLDSSGEAYCTPSKPAHSAHNTAASLTISSSFRRPDFSNLSNIKGTSRYEEHILKIHSEESEEGRPASKDSEDLEDFVSLRQTILFMSGEVRQRKEFIARKEKGVREMAVYV